MPRISKWTVILGLCSLATVVYTSHLALYHIINGDPEPFWQSFSESASDWYSWAILAPFILGLGSRFPFRRNRWALAVTVHVFASLFFSAAQIVLHAFFDQLLIHHTFSAINVARVSMIFFARTFHFGLLVYFLIVIAQNLIEYYKDQALRALEIETQLAQAQLNSLKMQLHPHFLFNTLHAINALIHEDPKTAEIMLARLSELLRVSLRSGNTHEVPLRKELEVLELYLDIERMRFHDRLRIATNIDPDVLDAYVPNLILQPLVENSIRHGIAKHRGTGIIEIAAKRLDDDLLLTVQDNGKGFPRTPEQLHEGVGLSNTRARLEQLYGSTHQFILQSQKDSGVIVSIRIPFKEAKAASI